MAVEWQKGSKLSIKEIVALAEMPQEERAQTTRIGEDMTRTRIIIVWWWIWRIGVKTRREA